MSAFVFGLQFGAGLLVACLLAYVAVLGVVVVLVGMKALWRWAFNGSHVLHNWRARRIRAGRW